MFEEIKGHEMITRHLARDINANEISHAYLFSGMDGIGKKKTARAFAKACLCLNPTNKGCDHCTACHQIEQDNHPDVKIVEAEDGDMIIKISHVREMISELSIKPFSGSWRINIIDGAERMTPEAQNSLLKSLEEPLHFNIFILITDQPQTILPTIRSRCQSYHFQSLGVKDIEKIIACENRGLNETTVSEAVSFSGGSPKTALQLIHNNEILQERTHYLREIYSLLKGDAIKVFTLSEVLSKDKILSQETLAFFIHWFYEVHLFLQGYPLPNHVEPSAAHRAFNTLLESKKSFAIVNVLFEMMDRIQYNSNLKLQWEKCLIEIMKIQKG